MTYRAEVMDGILTWSANGPWTLTRHDGSVSVYPNARAYFTRKAVR